MDSAFFKFLFTTITKVKRSVVFFSHLLYNHFFAMQRTGVEFVNEYGEKRKKNRNNHKTDGWKGAQFTQVLVPCTKNSQTHRCAKHLMGDILKWMCYLKAYVNHHLNDETSWYMWLISFLNLTFIELVEPKIRSTVY